MAENASMGHPVWEGAEDLRGMLVPIRDIELFPGNPRRGSVAAIAESLGRFGQLRPILYDTNSRRIVAGNHTTRAALDLGWTHIAAVPNKFADETEARAYLLADNRLPDLGTYEYAELIAMLEELEAADGWHGTGFLIDDLEDLRAAHGEVATTDPTAFAGGFAADEDELARRAALLAAGQPMKELVLPMTAEQHADFENHISILRKETGGDKGVTELVLVAVGAQAAQE